MRYSVVRVVPDPIRDEPVNVGVLLQDLTTGEASVRFVKNVERLRTYTGEDIDTSTVDFALATIKDLVGSRHSEPDFIERLSRQYTQLVQFSTIAGSVASDLQDELDALYERFVSLESRGRRGKYVAITRKKLVARVRQALEAQSIETEIRRRVDGLLGSFVFDFVIDRERYSSLQCISLAGDIDQSTEEVKALAYSVRDIRNRGQKFSERRVAEFSLTSLIAPPPVETEATSSVRRILADVGDIGDSEQEFDRALQSFANA
jgi:DNA-binding transcriptional regulator YbjK